MSKRGSDERLSRFLSLVLRHKPEAAGIQLDRHGWADVSELLAGISAREHRMNRDDLERIVREDRKQRYSFSEDGSRIRANQGHSLDVDVQLQRAVPPALLYHGTASRFLESIRAQGLTKQKRHHVHLSVDVNTAIAVGKRHGRAVVLPIDAAAMQRDGRVFYLSDNGVWLCDAVPWRYIGDEGLIWPDGDSEP